MIDINELRHRVENDGKSGIDLEEIHELLDRLEAAEEERDELLAGLDEWLDKTKWVQQGVNEGAISAKYIGLHRADVMTSLLGEAEKERDDLRAKITEMEKQEPVAFGLYSGWALKAIYLKEHEACEQRDRRQLTADLAGSLEAYRVVPLYALPGAQPSPSINPASLYAVINWLRNGCDPRKAADELEMFAATLEAKP